MRLASRFGYANQIRRDRPLTHEELMHYVPGIFGEDKHTSRSQNYTYIPTITVLESLQREGFQPFFACQTRVRDPGRRGYTKHMLRLRRAGEINGEHVPEIILLNSHDGTSSYQMLPGYFRFVCQNGCVCGQSLGEVRVPHRGNVVDRVIEGAYEVVGVFDRIEGHSGSMLRIWRRYASGSIPFRRQVPAFLATSRNLSAEAGIRGKNALPGHESPGHWSSNQSRFSQHGTNIFGEKLVTGSWSAQRVSNQCS